MGDIRGPDVFFRWTSIQPDDFQRPMSLIYTVHLRSTVVMGSGSFNAVMPCLEADSIQQKVMNSSWCCWNCSPVTVCYQQPWYPWCFSIARTALCDRQGLDFQRVTPQHAICAWDIWQVGVQYLDLAPKLLTYSLSFKCGMSIILSIVEP